MRCPECDTSNAKNARHCHRCGTALREEQRVRRPRAHGDPASRPVGETDRFPRGRRSPFQAPVAEVGASVVTAEDERAEAAGKSWPSTPSGPMSLAGGRGKPRLSGRVTAVGPIQPEPPDPSLPQMLHRSLLLVEFLGIPLLLLWGLLESYSPFSVVLGVLGLFVLFRFLTPHNLLATLDIGRRLHPTRRYDDPIPVQYVRLLDSQQREHLVRCKGVLQGQFLRGDEVTLTGAWQRGMFILSHGRNRQTGADLSVKRELGWLGLLVNVLILAVLFWLFREPVQLTLASLMD